jgi:pyridinium-3,5-bisthiocarboxylic acid mononucleotide nickel chelatase
MRVLQFDSVGGASGDMILGALIDLGVRRDELQRMLSRLGTEPFDIIAEPADSRHLRGTRVTVRLLPGEPHGHPTDHHHHHHDEHHHHRHHEPHVHDHPHRKLRDIEALLDGAELPAPVKATSLKVFRRLAEAEAAVHGTTPDDVHFHEVGAMDSIVDIVGSCLGLHLLGVDAVAVGPLPQGQGTIECAHGVFPNPPPAVARLLEGLPVVMTTEPFELVTPTGAALLSTWKSADAAPPGARIVKTGHGLGHRELRDRPNLLRGMLLETGGEDATPTDCLVMECNIDDCTPEVVGILVEKLLAAGALDVFTTAAQMKKQRPGVLLTVIAEPSGRDRLLDIFFRESTTFGIREYPVGRTILERRHEQVATAFGQIRVKIGRWRGEDVTFAPEMDDCRRAAEAEGLAVRLVYEQALRAAQLLRRDPPG